jgi:Pentapeptide repeats (9 copies)
MSKNSNESLLDTSLRDFTKIISIVAFAIQFAFIIIIGAGSRNASVVHHTSLALGVLHLLFMMIFALRRKWFFGNGNSEGNPRAALVLVSFNMVTQAYVLLSVMQFSDAIESLIASLFQPLLTLIFAFIFFSIDGREKKWNINHNIRMIQESERNEYREVRKGLIQAFATLHDYRTGDNTTVSDAPMDYSRNLELFEALEYVGSVVRNEYEDNDAYGVLFLRIKSELIGLTIANTDLSCIDLSRLPFTNCRFINVNFTKANFEKCRFEGCQFSNCNETDVSFTEAEYVNCTPNR